MNDKVRQSGASANMWVFGKSPQIPFDLLNTEGQIECLQGRNADEELRWRQQVRAQADVHINQFKIDDALRCAVNRKGRPSRQAYEPGELVAFWRNMKKKKGKVLQPGWHRGTIIGPHRGDDGQNNYWVTSNGRLILVSKEQLRPTYGTERWRIEEAELGEYLEQEPDIYEDETGDGPPSGEDAQDVPDDMVVPPLEDIVEAPRTAELPADLPPGEPSEVDLPRGQRRDYASSQPSDQTELPAGHPSAKVPKVEHAPQPPSASPGTPVGQLFRQPITPRGSTASEPDPKRLKTEDTAPPIAPSEEHIPILENERHATPTYGIMATRKEQKALEKEIPFHMIPDDQRQGYHDALVKEWGTWCKYEAVKVLDMEASQWVPNSVPPNRILSTRVCYRNKNAAFPWMPVKHKARIVCRGDQDPDLLTLRRDAPTMTRLSLMVICQLAASMTGWFMFNADITGAFLQGDQSMAKRKEQLFVRQPSEGLAGLVRGQLLLVVRGIFGLANSPRLFWRFLRDNSDNLLRMGFQQSTLDKALFFYYMDGQLILILGAHVDDLLGTGEPEKADPILKKLRETFDFGMWADSREESVLEYGGKQITRLDGVIKLSQSKFIQATSVSSIPRWRTATPGAALTASELTELRSVGGCLHWLTGQTRPDLAAGTSLYMTGQNPTISHLMNLNKLLKEAKQSQDWGITFRKIPLETAKILVFTDSSWANAAFSPVTRSTRHLATWEVSWTGDRTGSAANAGALWLRRRWQWMLAWMQLSSVVSSWQRR